MIEFEFLQIPEPRSLAKINLPEIIPRAALLHIV